MNLIYKRYLLSTYKLQGRLSPLIRCTMRGKDKEIRREIKRERGGRKRKRESGRGGFKGECPLEEG